jgi:hypothetical protein
MSSLLEIAVQKTWTILEKLENGKSGIRTEAPPSSTWCQLLLATLACADDEILRTILACTAEFPSALDFRQVQVPAAISMLSWESSQKRRLPPVAKSWIDSIRRQLICAAKLRPLPPSDLVRHATINCTCELCQQLTQFLLDPALEKVVLKVPLHDQDHIKYTILKSALDLSIKHVRLGVRHAIEFTKTTDSYHAALLQYQEDVKRLEALGPHSEGCN